MLAIQASGLPVNQAGDPVTVSKWCKNTTQPDLQLLARISELLNIDIRKLLVKRKVNIQHDL